MDKWEFSANIEEDGDLLLEWYLSKGNVVTVCFSATRHEINWAALVESVAHHGCVRQSSQSDIEVKQ